MEGDLGRTLRNKFMLDELDSGWIGGDFIKCSNESRAIKITTIIAFTFIVLGLTLQHWSLGSFPAKKSMLDIRLINQSNFSSLYLLLRLF